MVRLVFRPILKYDERFARQYRYKPPSEFPLNSLFSSIVHHLSGPNTYVLTQTFYCQLVRCQCKDTSACFIMSTSLPTHELAHMLDSLVRVSRRVKGNSVAIAINRQTPTIQHTILCEKVGFYNHRRLQCKYAPWKAFSCTVQNTLPFTFCLYTEQDDKQGNKHHKHA